MEPTDLRPNFVDLLDRQLWDEGVPNSAWEKDFLANRLASFQVTRGFRAYLYQAARNLYLDEKRKQKPSYTLEGQSEPVATGDSPEHQAEAAELARRIEAALRQLPAREQAVLR